MRESGTHIKAVLNLGSYTVPDAARLLNISDRNIKRWLGGYSHKQSDGSISKSAPLWSPDHVFQDDTFELSFRDLVELRIVSLFEKEGIGLLKIRNLLSHAREQVKSERPFSTLKFKTDGVTIYLDSTRDDGHSETVDLKTGQLVIKKILEQTFKDFDIEDDIVKCWRPYKGKQSIIINPKRSFGQPICTDYGVPTSALYNAYKAEGTAKDVARLYEVPLNVVKDAIQFEEMIKKAA